MGCWGLLVIFMLNGTALLRVLGAVLMVGFLTAPVTAARDGERVVSAGARYKAGPSLVEVAHLAGEKARSIAFSGRFAWLGQNLAGAELLDVTSPEHPKRIRTFAPEEMQPLDLKVVDGNLLVVADRFRGLVLWDIKRPAKAVKLGSVEVNGIATHVDVTMVGGRRIAAVACGGEGMMTADITDPANPVRLGHFRTRVDYSRRLALDGNIAYLADHVDGGLKVLDIAKPAEPQPFFQVALRGFCESVTRRDDLLAVGYRNYGIRLFELKRMPPDCARDEQTTPALRLLCNVMRGRSEVRDVLLLDHDLMVAANDVTGLELYDVHNRELPVLLDEYEFRNESTSAQSVQEHNGYLYVPSWDGGLYILKVAGVNEKTD